jgi:hypothetical protein
MSQPRTTVSKDELWKILVDTAHTLTMYKNHKRYVEDVMLKEKPGISPQELAIQINVSLGEAIVILDELRGGKPPVQTSETPASQRPSDRTLFDFSR